MMQRFWQALGALAILLAVIAAAIGGSRMPAAARKHAAASPSPSPTASGSPAAPSTTSTPRPLPSPSLSPGAQPPTPYMPLDQIPNGDWLIIQQGPDNPSYSRMTLKDVGTAVTGTWQIDKKTIYFVSGNRQGARMLLDLRIANDPKITTIGKIDATLDGIADMYGLITLNGKDTPFQGAQHSRVPPPVEATGGPSPTPGPFGQP